MMVQDRSQGQQQIKQDEMEATSNGVHVSDLGKCNGCRISSNIARDKPAITR